jgi:hypothetical protein
MILLHKRKAKIGTWIFSGFFALDSWTFSAGSRRLARDNYLPIDVLIGRWPAWLTTLLGINNSFLVIGI